MVFTTGSNLSLAFLAKGLSPAAYPPDSSAPEASEARSSGIYLGGTSYLPPINATVGYLLQTLLVMNPVKCVLQGLGTSCPPRGPSGLRSVLCGRYSSTCQLYLRTGSQVSTGNTRGHFGRSRGRKGFRAKRSPSLPTEERIGTRDPVNPSQKKRVEHLQSSM